MKDLRCPFVGCNSTIVESAATIFYEFGEWNGRSYEDEGCETVYRCSTGAHTFAIDLPTSAQEDEEAVA